MVVASSKRTDNQMLDPQGGEFRITARGEQLSSMSAATTFDLTFDFNGSDQWPMIEGDAFYLEIDILGIGHPGTGPAVSNVWKAKIFLASGDGTMKTAVPTGGTFTLDPQFPISGSGSEVTVATPSVIGAEGYFSIRMTVDTAYDFDWRAVVKGLYAVGESLGS